jgi:hypothetical protein
MVSGTVGPAVNPEELAKARRAFRGSLESSKAWRGFSPHPRHHDVTYWTLLTVLFIEPGMNRMSLIERIIDYAGVSRSTAERAVREARAAGFIADAPAGKEVRYELSDRLFAHCLEFFRNYMDLERVLANLGDHGEAPRGRPG